MNIEALRRKLIDAARASSPPDHVPHAFEKRIMAHLPSARAEESHFPISITALWRAVASCVALMLMTCVWSFAAARFDRSPEQLAAALEDTVMAPLDLEGDAL